MLGLPVWLWIVLAGLAIPYAIFRWYYARFRRVCRNVRAELTEFLKAHHPDIQVIGEQKGNLLLRMSSGEERLWELVDVFVAVARLPGMGRDPGARQRIYEKAVELLILSGPLSLATHGGKVKLHLVKPEFLATAPAGAVVPHTPFPSLGLVALYVLDLPQNTRFLTDRESKTLGLDVAGLHNLALENLRKDFPRQMVADAIKGESGTAICSGDTFDAARLLLIPECLKDGEALVALVPHRDMLVLGPASLQDDRSKLQEGMQVLECSEHPPLLNQPVRVSSRGFELIVISTSQETASE